MADLGSFKAMHYRMGDGSKNRVLLVHGYPGG